MHDSALVCFRNDFRLLDNPALFEAVRLKKKVIPVFIYDPSAFGDWDLGGASKWWLHQSIKDIQKQVASLGGRLILRKGSTASIMRELVESTQVSSVYWNRRYLLSERTVDAVVKEMLLDLGIEVKSFQASLLVEPWTTANKEGNPFKVYSPFWRSIKDNPIPEPLELDFSKIEFADENIECLGLDDLDLIPKDKTWHGPFHDFWKVSEMNAHDLLLNFIHRGIDDYAVDRDRPDLNGTSSLSPYLRWGQISPRQIAHALIQNCDLNAKGPTVYLKEIYWREFAYYVMYHFPETSDSPLQEKYKNFPWNEDKSTLSAWKWGKTGYPIVDAGMRQLYATGWMHNRVRMIVASLLVKHLLHSWHAGAEWFWDTLVDADLASNTQGWQWAAGCGADAAPYFRIFNPTSQQQKFDPEEKYIDRWVVRDEMYPEPIVDHAEARKQALSALKQVTGK